MMTTDKQTKEFLDGFMGARGPQPGCGGRTKGIPNKKTQDLADLIEAACPGFNPVIAMAKIAHLGTINSFVPDEQGQYHWVTERIGTEHRAKCLTEVAQYIAPKRKAVEHSGEIATSGGVLLVEAVKSPDEWLANNQAVQATVLSMEE